MRIGGIHDDSRCSPRTGAGPRNPQDRRPGAACGPCTRRTSRRFCGSSARHFWSPPTRRASSCMVRDEGDHLNTHFRGFPAPMGMALSGDRLAVGTKIQVWEFVDVPAVTAKLEPPGPARCLLPAPLQPRHGQHPDPRDGLGRRQRALGRQHPVLLPLHARRLGQLRAAVAAAVCQRARAHRPLSLERPGDGRRPPAVRDGAGRNRRAGRLAREQGQGRHRDGRGLGRGDHPRAVDAPLSAVVRRPALGLRVGCGDVRVHRPEHRQVRAHRRGPRLHPRARFRWQPRVRRPVAGAREPPCSAASRSPSG